MGGYEIESDQGLDSFLRSHLNSFFLHDCLSLYIYTYLVWILGVGIGLRGIPIPPVNKFGDLPSPRGIPTSRSHSWISWSNWIRVFDAHWVGMGFLALPNKTHSFKFQPCIAFEHLDSLKKKLKQRIEI